MKKTITIITVVLCTLMSVTTQAQDFDFVGKWKGDDGSEVGHLVFEEEGYAYFEINGQKFGGKEFMYQGKRGSMSYKVDHSKTPIHIDMVITKLDENISKSILCIVEIINDNELRFAMTFDEARPKNFEEGKSMIFKRVKE